MLELLSPAGSPEAVRAAVQNGANAVYMGFGAFNARRRAKNFTGEEFAQAVEYCHVRDVKVYLTLNTLLTDRELEQAGELIGNADRMGVDAVLVQDLGVLRLARQLAPELPLHASTQMTIHNLDGAELAASLGLTRVVLARELSRKQIAYITRRAPVETEVFVHGAHCMCYSGQCAMSALIGGRSGNRGACAQPCRMSYGWNGRADGFPLSLKDMSLAGHLRELEDMGVACVKIEGRMKRPEYVAVVTDIYARAIRERREPTAEELERLRAAFSRQGFTDGYYMGRKGPEMFGVRQDGEREPAALLGEARASYAGREKALVPVRLSAVFRRGEPARVTAGDKAGRTFTAEGESPQAALRRETTPEEIQRQLEKTGGTPYFCASVQAQAEPGLFLPAAQVNDLRRRALDGLTVLRGMPERRRAGEAEALPPVQNRKEPPKLIISALRAEQLTEELVRLGAERLCLPLTEAAEHPEAVARLMGSGSTLAVQLPRVISDGEREDTLRKLEAVRSLGIREALANNLGQLPLLRSLDFVIRGDLGLNVTNSGTLEALRELGLRSAAVSFELLLAQIRDMNKRIDTEIVVYGRLPLMITENCILKNRTGRCVCDRSNALTDQTGACFPVLREEGCRNVIYNSRVLFLADRAADYGLLGLWAARLSFTTETPEECLRVVRRYLGREDRLPGEYTRGLYYRGLDKGGAVE